MNDVMRIVKEEEPEILSQSYDMDCSMTLRIRQSAMPRLRSRLEKVETARILDEEKGGGAKFYKIITVNNRTEEHTADFAKDYLKIKELALRDKQIKVIAKWSEEKIKETYIKISDDYKDCDFVNNWLKK